MVKVAVFDTHRFERELFEQKIKKENYDFTFFDVRLTEQTVQLASGHEVVCAFANDRLNWPVVETLHHLGVRFIALRSAGHNHVDLNATAQLGIKVARVPEYSPYAVAEHAALLILALNRKICKANMRVRDLNFSLDGLVGFDLHGKTVGVIGLGRIGAAFARIMKGFGCQVLGFDSFPNKELENEGVVTFVDLNTLLSQSHIISLHVPLTPQTKHLMKKETFALMRSGVMLINTGRGALIHTKDLIEALKIGRIGSAGLDVYEEEEGVFFHDLSGSVLQDDQLARLLTFPNVLVTSHQGFLTHEALQNIIDTTLFNIEQFINGVPLTHEVHPLSSI